MCAPRTVQRHATARLVAVALALLASVLAGGCTRAVDGEPAAAGSDFDSEHPTPPAPVLGGGAAPTDVLASKVVSGVEGYWRTAFPAAFGRPWANLHGYYAVDPKTAPSPPPCVHRALDLDDQAVYCPELDTIAWDRVTLLPRLAKVYGPGAVVVALAHEMGHAVQNRLGINAEAQLRQKDRYPTLLLETMADCYAGTAMRAVVAGQVPGVTVSRTDLDRALRALLSFRDPINVIGGRTIAPHGNAFDRASAFIDGYVGGPTACAGMTVQNQIFTQRAYTSIVEEALGGDMALPNLETALSADAGWFGKLVTQRGGRWRPPTLLPDGPTTECSGTAGRGQGAASYCVADNTLRVSPRQLGAVHDALGDYASGAVLVSRYALATLAELGRPVRGADTSPTVLCLTGAYTRAVFDRNTGFTLSPGDIDEAVNELLTQDVAARDLSGAATPGELGFERIEHFRAGVLGGPGRCGL